MSFLRSVIALCSGFANYRAYRDLALSTSLKHLLKLVMLLALAAAARLLWRNRQTMALRPTPA